MRSGWVSVAAIVAASIVVGGCSKNSSSADAGVVGDAAARDPARIVCPGDPSCKPGPQQSLLVGAAALKITPQDCESWTDNNKNYQYDQGDTFEDRNGNGKFDACWIAGQDYSQAANGIHDDIWARVIVLRQDETTVALVSIDVIGLFHDEVKKIQAALDTALGVDLVFLSSTHNHSGPDTLGLWGPSVDKSGINPTYQARLRQTVVDAIREATGKLQPAELTYAETRTVDENGSTEPYVSDTRDPVVIDPTLTLLRFAAKSDGKTIATLINWGAHPDTPGSKRNAISSDYPNWLRKGIEEGVRGQAGVGGVAAFFVGMVGGQIGPGRVKPKDSNGQVVTTKDLSMAQAIGESVAVLGLKALAAATDKDAAPKLSFATASAKVKVENLFFQTAYLLKVLDRELVDFDRDKPISEKNVPWLPTQIVSLQLGKAHLLGIPGELHPELAIGYDKQHAYNWPQVSPTNKNPPDLTKAPPGPYLKELMQGRYKLIVGLAQDMLGYIIPAFNFEVDKSLPYVLEPPGNHYEETRSAGPSADQAIVGALRGLIKAQ